MTQALNKINDAKQAFMTLPARLRLELGNDFTRIDELTEEQIKYYGLGKPVAPTSDPEVLPPSPAEEPKAPARSKAGQADPKAPKPTE